MLIGDVSGDGSYELAQAYAERYPYIRVARLGCEGRLCTVGGTHGYPAETYEAEWFSDTEQRTFEEYKL